jgi:hypothetical protein
MDCDYDCLSLSSAESSYSLDSDQEYSSSRYESLISDLNLDPESDQLPDAPPLLVRQAAFVSPSAVY